MKTIPQIKPKAMFRSLIIIVLLFISAFIIIENIIYTKMKEDTLKQILLTSELTNRSISDIFSNTKLIAEQMGTNKEVKEYIRDVKTREDITGNPHYAPVLDTLKDIVATNKNIYLSWVGNERVNFCLDSSETITDSLFITKIRPWYQSAVESSEAAFSQPYYEYTSNTLSISCAKAIREGNQIIGFVSVDIRLDSLPLIMKDFTIGENGKNILLTNTGTVVFTSQSPQNKELISLTELLPYLDHLKTNKNDYEEIKLDNKYYYLTSHVFTSNNWAIIQLIDEAEMMKPFHNTLNKILGVFLVSCLISIVIVFLNIYEHKNIQHKLEKEASTDYLTGIHNRKYFFESSLTAFKSSKDGHEKLSLLMIDIDKFKGINDTYGHDIGDTILNKAAREFEKAVRKDDIFCRFGGDEFAILLIETDQEMALTIANRILDNVSHVQIANSKGNISFSVSIGVATLENVDQNIESLLKRADEALYRAKESGRNQVSI